MQWLLRRRVLKIYPMFFYDKLWTPSGAPLLVRGSRFWQFSIFTIYTSFPLNVGIFGAGVLQMILKYFSDVFLNPSLGPGFDPRVTGFFFNFHYTNKLSCKYWHFLCSGSWGEKIKDTHPIPSVSRLSPFLKAFLKGLRPLYYQMYIPSS